MKLKYLKLYFKSIIFFEILKGMCYKFLLTILKSSRFFLLLSLTLSLKIQENGVVSYTPTFQGKKHDTFQSNN